MNQKLLDNPNPSITANLPVLDNGEQLQHRPTVQKEICEVDKVPSILNSLNSGKKHKNEDLNLLLNRIQNYESKDELVNFSEKLFHTKKQNFVVVY